MKMLKAGVLGASGIGKFHAEWLHNLGAEVVAFLGSSEESVGRTRQTLEELFGFEGSGYSNLDKLLESERLDVVVVSTPNHLHYEHSVKCLRAGINVLCEKPMVWDGALGSEELIHQSEEMARTAEEAGKILALNLQYMVLAEEMKNLFREVRGEEPRFGKFRAFMSSKLKEGLPTGREIWIDLSPHPISVLQKLVPEGHIRPGEYDQREYSQRANFQYGECQCEITTEKIPGTKFPRWFEIDGFKVEYEGRRDAEGKFKTHLSYEGGQKELPDIMMLSIKHFLDAVEGRGEVVCAGNTGLKNLIIMLEIMKG